MPLSDANLLLSTRACRLATWQNVVVVDWLDIPTSATVDAFAQAIRETAEAHEKATVIVRVRAPMKIPPAEIRNQLTQLIRQSERSTSGWFVAVEGDGFWAAAHRGFSASMHLLSGSRTRMKIVATIDEAVESASRVAGQSRGMLDAVLLKMASPLQRTGTGPDA